MFLDHFFRDDDGAIRISAAQGSAFAKAVAGDFNPLHDVDNPRFCVPGDLLFALVLARHGLASRMAFHFKGMVGADMPLTLVAEEDHVLARDAGGKTCMEVISAGPTSRDTALIESLVRRYVAFSGHNFPHILVPLMDAHGVMINTDRPLVIYERMSFELDRLDRSDLELVLVSSRLEVNGRRGAARLGFEFRSDGEAIGQGAKSLVLSGLREHDRTALQGLVERYVGWQTAYQCACEAS
jgi:hypothetical protein